VNFQKAQEYLDSLQMHKIKLGLEAMESLLEKAARPDRKLRFVHIAGTNGKGSVCVNIVSILKNAGYRVGLFTSPHLSSVRERFRINDSYISEETFAGLASRLRDILAGEKITYFEFTTALALLWFSEAGVDLVVLETGLGGRLDATNVVIPLVSVITNVSMDHEAYLGNTLESIAFEKAGIIKKGVDLVCGVQTGVGLDVVEKRCRELQAPLSLYGRDFDTEDDAAGWIWRGRRGGVGGMVFSALQCGMKGDYQRENSALAIAVVSLLRQHGYRCSENDVRAGLAAVHWPGRLEFIALSRKDRSLLGHDDHDGLERSVRYLLDGAHNPAGVEKLVQTLKKEYAFNRLILIWGAMEDKDLRLTLPPVAALASIIILTRPQGERAASPVFLSSVLDETTRMRCHLIAPVDEALRFAEEQAQQDDLIVVAGSLYLVGEIRCKLVGELTQQGVAAA
jgi:dihydrofolate synthase/folylpolyglutamate synthase